MSSSLTESSLVVGIFAILISLMPKLICDGLAISKKMECFQGLKDLGQASFQFAYDHDDQLPHEDFSSTQGPCWYDAVNRHLKKQPIYLSKQDPSLRYLHHENSVDSGFSYKMNSRLEGYKGSNQESSPDLRSINSISHPKETVLYFDGDISTEYWINKPYGMYKQVSNRHSNRANLFLMDGSLTSSSGNSLHDVWLESGGFRWDPDSPAHLQ